MDGEKSEGSRGAGCFGQGPRREGAAGFAYARIGLEKSTICLLARCRAEGASEQARLESRLKCGGQARFVEDSIRTGKIEAEIGEKTKPQIYWVGDGAEWATTLTIVAPLAIPCRNPARAHKDPVPSTN